MAHTLILGGIRSGKTALAEATARIRAQQSRKPIVYVATAAAGDAEMQARIMAHQAQRPAAWGLLEEPVHLAAILSGQAAEAPCLLIDCMSLWLNNLLMLDEAAMQAELAAFVTAVADYPGDTIVVSNEVGLGIIGMDPLTRRFADELGWLNQRLAAAANEVMMSVAGLPLVLKPSSGR